ncbi:hypothetical protein GGF46_000236, partial [Coemansia sp. RSA 552]
MPVVTRHVYVTTAAPSDSDREVSSSDFPSTVAVQGGETQGGGEAYDDGETQGGGEAYDDGETHGDGDNGVAGPVSPAGSDDGSITDNDGQGLYPPSALFMRQCLPESAWEADEATNVCRQCARRFNLFVRRHHCRRCGLVFCDGCSAQRTFLASPMRPVQTGYYAQGTQGGGSCTQGAHNGTCGQGRLESPEADDTTPLAQVAANQGHCRYWQFREHRTCSACAEAVGHLPAADGDSMALVMAGLGSSDAAENAYNIFGQVDGREQRRRMSSASARICPVCDRAWAAVWGGMARVPGEGWQEAQERHIRDCIDDTSAEMQGGRGQALRSRSIQIRPAHSLGAAAGSPAGLSSSSQPRPVALSEDTRASALSDSSRAARSPAGVKYVAYKLNGDTPLLGQECIICFEAFEPAQHVARLNCLCTYHLSCIADWLQRAP